MTQPLTIDPGTKIKLSEFSPGFKGQIGKQKAMDQTQQHVKAIIPLAERLYAENRRVLLLILQGMDASGKDGTIRTVMRGVNPQSCQVLPFKEPSQEELDHDFLWRIHRAIPARGNIGIFNRSHYEDVLVVRVRNLVPKQEWKQRYEKINDFEKLLAQSDVNILKVFLHISKDEQRQRLQARLDNPQKRWKFRLGDLEDRKLWDEFQEAYEDALTECNTKEAPWHIVPADHKWYRNLVVSRLVRQALEAMDPQFPQAKENLDGIVVP